MGKDKKYKNWRSLYKRDKNPASSDFNSLNAAPVKKKPAAKRVAPILNQNQDKPFVQRILSPEGSPSLDYGDGYRATHQMSWSERDGKFLVYPNIMLEPSGELLERKGAEAFEEAVRRNNYIEFKTAEEADWFSKNYKSVWPEDQR